MLNFQYHFLKRTPVGPQFHNGNRFRKFIKVRFKRIHESILQLISLVPIRIVCMKNYLNSTRILKFQSFGMSKPNFFWKRVKVIYSRGDTNPTLIDTIEKDHTH